MIPVPDAVTPVSAEPSSAGSAPVNCAEGRFVKDAPEPLNVVAVRVPVTLAPALLVANYTLLS